VQRLGLRLDRQLNTFPYIYLKMFPYIRNTPKVWVGVILLGEVHGWAKPINYDEAQGLRIE
jgi:hypothetical protein